MLSYNMNEFRGNHEMTATREFTYQNFILRKNNNKNQSIGSKIPIDRPPLKITKTVSGSLSNSPS